MTKRNIVQGEKPKTSKKAFRRKHSSVISLSLPGKVRWRFEKPDVMPCVKYKVDPVALATGQLVKLEAKPPKLKSQAIDIPVVKTKSIEPKPLPTSPRAVKTFAELKVSDELAFALNGAREAPNQAGRVDVLTRKYVIEVKVASDWKHGIGQALVYSFYYRDKQPVLFLFGDDIKNYRDIAKSHCKRLGVIYSEVFTELV